MQYREREGTRRDRVKLRAKAQRKVRIIRAAVPSAREVIERTERIELSERDTLLVLDLLENPPPPSAKLIAALKAWAENQENLEKM